MEAKNTFLNNQQITEEIKKGIKICIEMNENENTTTQNLWDTVKAVLSQMKMGVVLSFFATGKVLTFLHNFLLLLL